MTVSAAASGPRILVFGYHDIGVACLDVLFRHAAQVVAVATHHDDPAEHVWFASVAELAQRHALPVHTPDDPNSPEAVATFRAYRPDLIFSFYYRHLLSKALLDLPRLGAVNLHGSLLPKYRGRAPLNWVLVHGETETGVTLHYMDHRADHGDIIGQTALPIALEDTALTLSRKLTAAAAQLLDRWYPALATGTAVRVPQDDRVATIFGRRRPADGCIDWSRTAWQIYNLIRAVTRPFPGAFSWLNGRRVYVWSARAPDGRRASGPPGQILGVGADASLAVATGEGVLELLRLQAADGPETDGLGLLAALAAPVGACFGDTERRSA